MSSYETYLLIAVLLVLAFILLGASVVLNTAIRNRQGSHVVGSDIQISDRLKSNRFFLYATVGGTLTSLASVYVFFILQYPFFGWAMFFTLAAFPLGGLVGQLVAKKAVETLRQSSAGRAAFETGLMTAVVRVNSNVLTSQLVRYLSMLNITAVIWLEIKVLTTILCNVVFQISFEPRNAIIFAVVAGLFTVLLVQFILRFGMQGVIATDAMYWPFIILSAALIAAVVFYLSFNAAGDLSHLVQMISLRPRIPDVTLAFFLLNIFAVNAVYHVGRDDLWLRMSAFQSTGQKDNPAASQLFQATLFAVPVWFILISVGMLVPTILGRPADSVLEVIGLIRVSYVVLPLAILGLLAAMLSTCDNQFFALKRLFRYSPETGEVRELTLNWRKTAAISFSAGLIVALLTWAAIYFDLKDQNLVFACLGLPAVIYPAVQRSLNMRQTRTGDVLVPVAIFLFMLFLGIRQGSMPSLYIVAAAPVSMVVGLILINIRK